MRIDWHVHINDPKYMGPKWWKHPVPMTVEHALDAHRLVGLDRTVISNAVHYIRFCDTEKDALAAIESSNRYLAKCRDDHPDKFVAMATCIPGGTDDGLRELERAVKATLGQEKYTWRLPREKVAAIDGPVKGWLRELIDGLVETTLGWMRTLRDFAREVIHWLRDIFKTNPKAADARQSSRLDWMLVLRGFAYVLIGLSALALALLLWRVARQGWKGRTAIVAEVLPAQPDLTDENLTASQLPEDGWLKLARELMEKGELRLAVRALYLAGLAHLAEREMISLARFKSNRDYEQEVARRGRGQPELRAAFSENVALFDRVWYGLYEVTSEALGRFQINLERIRAC